MKKVRNKIYISGPMSGLPENNYPAFMEAEQRLRHLGDIVNPARIEHSVNTWEGFMRADIKALMDCDTIYMLPGWTNSKGARLEFLIAKELGMGVLNFESIKS